MVLMQIFEKHLFGYSWRLIFHLIIIIIISGTVRRGFGRWVIHIIDDGGTLLAIANAASLPVYAIVRFDFPIRIHSDHSMEVSIDAHGNPGCWQWLGKLEIQTGDSALAGAVIGQIPGKIPAEDGLRTLNILAHVDVDRFGAVQDSERLQRLNIGLQVSSSFPDRAEHWLGCCVIDLQSQITQVVVLKWLD